MRGIILRCTPFKETQKISTLFSEELGLISMIIKGVSAKNSYKLSFTEPFCEADFLLTKRKSDLYLFEEGSILDLHLFLRKDLSFLKTASSMINAILRSQLPGKSAPSLYALLSLFLKKIPLFPNTQTLLTCFYLKILKHEGVFSIQEESSFFSTQEKQLLSFLLDIQTFAPLNDLYTPSSLLEKVEILFNKNCD